jgi:hypothetical protein
MAMIQTVIFVLFLALPLFLYLMNSGVIRRETRGIAGGISKPKAAKTPAQPKARKAVVRTRRTSYCGRGFTHFALALVGSQDACRYCSRLESVPPGSNGEPDPDGNAAIAEAEEIINQAKQ